MVLIAKYKRMFPVSIISIANKTFKDVYRERTKNIQFHISLSLFLQIFTCTYNKVSLGIPTMISIKWIIQIQSTLNKKKGNVDWLIICVLNLFWNLLAYPCVAFAYIYWYILKIKSIYLIITAPNISKWIVWLKSKLPVLCHAFTFGN